MKTAYLTAGVPTLNATLYWKLRFSVGDPAALIEFVEPQPYIKEAQTSKNEALLTSSTTRLLILRDIEMDRAIQTANADYIACPANFKPESGLSGDREIATAQSVAEALRRYKITQVISDRSLPFIFADLIRQNGIEIKCDINRGVLERRSKDSQEIAWIREAQKTTEDVMTMACRMVANAEADSKGFLYQNGEILTSEMVRAAIDHFLLDRGYANVPSIVAGKKDGGDCHELGTGPLKTGEPVIIDIFPTNMATRYNGDCTRTVIHGTIKPVYLRIHEAVCAAKKAAMATIRAGISAETVHEETIKTLEKFGFGYAIPGSAEATYEICLTHGTGHGLGLSVHEPPLLDFGGPELVVGDVVSVEPGLYSKTFGGIRVEDMVVVTENGCENLGQPISESLNWDDCQ